MSIKEKYKRLRELHKIMRAHKGTFAEIDEYLLLLYELRAIPQEFYDDYKTIRVTGSKSAIYNKLSYAMGYGTDILFRHTFGMPIESTDSIPTEQQINPVRKKITFKPLERKKWFSDISQKKLRRKLFGEMPHK
ncbi:MAG TPA: hypothetical protein PLS84_03145 [Salinivirgaceae bacterium]|nr:hypothetical protein [Salinivirgaceae bacterium]